jgi:hypothetical protein
MATSIEIPVFFEDEWALETNVLQQNTLILGMRGANKTTLCHMLVNERTQHLLVARPFYRTEDYSHVDQRFVYHETEVTTMLRKMNESTLPVFAVIDCNDLGKLAENVLFKAMLTDHRKRFVVTALVPSDHEKMMPRMLFWRAYYALVRLFDNIICTRLPHWFRKPLEKNLWSWTGENRTILRSLLETVNRDTAINFSESGSIFAIAVTHTIRIKKSDLSDLPCANKTYCSDLRCYQFSPCTQHACI